MLCFLWLDKCTMKSIDHFGIIQSIFTSLKISWAVLVPSPTPLPTATSLLVYTVLPFPECHIQLTLEQRGFELYRSTYRLAFSINTTTIHGSDGKECILPVEKASVTYNAGDRAHFLVWEDPLEKGMATHSRILENPRDKGSWQAIVHGIAKSWTQVND